MILSPASTLIALLICPAPAFAASTAARWRGVDGLLAEVKTAHAAFGRCTLPEAGAPSSGASGACIEKILSDPELKQRFAFDLIVRQICLSLAAGRPDTCDSLAEVRGNPESGQRMCRRLYAMSRFSADLISGAAGTAASCAAWCDLAPSLPPQDLIGRVCGSLMKGEYSRACNFIVEWKTPGHGYSPVECEWEMQSVLGISTEEACRRNRRPGSDVCVATERFKKAQAASDPKLCGGDSLCRAMMGENGSACARLDEDLRAKACASGPAAAPPRAPTERDCVQSRAKAIKRLDEAGRRLKEAELAKDPGFSSRQSAFSDLEARQKELETAFLTRSGGRSSPPRSAGGASYAGDWNFYSMPKAVTGRCGAPGPDGMKEKLRGSIHVDETGHFIFFAGRVAIVGNVDLAIGTISGTLTDPYCGEGPISGGCAKFSECSGSYFQSSPAGPDGEANSETGAFRLAR